MTKQRNYPLTSIALLSASALATELYLVRLFAIIQWHHAAYMVISLALLGYGISGTLLAFIRKPALTRFKLYYILLIAGFAIVLPLCIWSAQHLDFNAELLLWQKHAWLRMAGVFLLLALPFLFAATAIGLALDAARTSAAKVYAADLLGAGLGALGLVMLLAILPIQLVPACIITLILSAAAISVYELNTTKHIAIPVILMLLIATWLIPQELYRPNISEFKPLAQALRIAGAHRVKERSGPLASLTIVKNPQVPLRHAPGLSLYAQSIPDEQLAFFEDASNMTAITLDKDKNELEWLHLMPSALPYKLTKPNHVLIAGAGGGMDILQAIHLSEAKIDVIEPNIQRIKLLQQFSGLNPDARLHFHHADTREFIQRTDTSYDLIIFGPGGAGGGTSGMHALNTSYQHTTEAYNEYLAALTPRGRIVISSWLQLPPRAMLKHVATAIQALQSIGNINVGSNLLVSRSLQTSTLLFGTTSFSAAEVNTFKAFNKSHGFDNSWYYGMELQQANLINRLPHPWLYESIWELSQGTIDAYVAKYKFDTRPATDDQPYFHHFFRWPLVKDILSQRGKGGMSLVEGGYLVLLATLILAMITGLLLILVPLIVYRRKIGINNKTLVSLAGYFICLGLSFLLIEITFIERLTIVLGNPVYSVAVTLTGFLIFAGLGSALTNRLQLSLGVYKLLWLSTFSIILVVSLHLLIGDWLTQTIRVMPKGIIIPVVLIIIMPLAIPMGIPFPLGLNWLADHAPDFTPWAWGLNGFASVVSAVLAIVLAMQWGFSVVMLIAVCLYLVAALLMSPSLRQYSD